MKLLIIRHADPDYSIDSLTETGWTEAELLSERLVKLDIKAFYTSPLGRAKDTASCTLKKLNRQATECAWLKEFPPAVLRPDTDRRKCAWDWLPADWTSHPEFFDKDLWYTNELFKEAHVEEEYRYVTEEFDNLLAKHGYERNGNYYHAVHANNDTIALFCHFGLECVLLSHLLNVSPMILWHGMCAAPSSVTTVTTEERREGNAYFRINAFSDTSHLYVADRAPSFAARFCETFANENERHD